MPTFMSNTWERMSALYNRIKKRADENLLFLFWNDEM